MWIPVSTLSSGKNNRMPLQCSSVATPDAVIESTQTGSSGDPGYVISNLFHWGEAENLTDSRSYDRLSKRTFGRS